MSALADPADMPKVYAAQEQDPEKHEKDGSVAHTGRPLSEEPTRDGEGALRPVVADAFAIKEGDEDAVDMKTLGWLKAGLVITCEAIALGTLSFPSTFKRLGMVGGFLANLLFVIIAYISCYVMVDFKLKYPYVMNVADAGEIMFGKWGSRIIGVGVIAKSIGLASSHILAGKIAISTFDSGANCAIGWAVLIAVVSAILSYQRHWSALTPMSVVSLTCIVTACIVTMVAAAKQDPARLVKNDVPVKWVSFNTDSGLVDVIGALTNVVFAYGQNMAVFSFLPEMKRPQDFKKSIILMQAIQLVIYSVVGGVIYSYGGQYTPSPALTMTPRTTAIISYAFALVTIIVSGIVAVNVGAKFAYVAFFRNSPMLTSRSWKAQGAWVAIVCSMYIIGFILAELIPFFNALLTIVSCLFSTWFVCGLGGLIWFHLYNPRLPENAGRGGWFSSPARCVMAAISLFLIIISCIITPLGLYSAIESIITGYRNGSYTHPFSCEA
ncbi:hypothetical protein JCM11641_006508 [Rhodosporidiobolus odoratus]